MTITEKVSYLKGLLEGLGLDESTKEAKLFKAVVDVLDDIALSVADLEDDLVELSDQVDEIDEDLAEVEEELFGDDDCCCCDDEDCDCCDCDEDFYEVTCAKCGETTYITAEVLEDGGMECPNCGESLEFELDFDEDECSCGCGCDCEDK